MTESLPPARRHPEAVAELFEELVLDVLIAMGDGGSWEDAAQHLGKSDDEGIDGRINQAHWVSIKSWCGRSVMRRIALSTGRPFSAARFSK